MNADVSSGMCAKKKREREEKKNRHAYNFERGKTSPFHLVNFYFINPAALHRHLRQRKEVGPVLSQTK